MISGGSESGWRRTRPAGLVCLALFCLLFFAPLCADTWYEEYDRGLKRLRKGDASAAVSAFKAALDERGSPGTRVRAYGMRYLDYFPHLMLGKAYLQMERYDDALQELEASLSAGAAPAGEVQPLLQRARQEKARTEPPETVTIVSPPPPPAPAGVRASLEGVGGRVRLDWNPVAGADHYEAQYSAVGEAWPAEGSIRAAKATTLLTGLSRGEIRGRVRAVSAESGAGPWSTAATVTLVVGVAEARAAGAKFESGRSSMESGRFSEAAAALTEAAAVLEGRADCLAMIGTCHATLHFLKNDPARKAEAHRWFRLALEADPVFRLDEGRVSPKIVRMLDDLR